MRLKLMRCLAIRFLVYCPAGDLLVSIFGYYFAVVPVYLLLVLPPTVYVSSLVSSVV